MTHVIIAHPHHDGTTEFAATMAALCQPGDRVDRVDESVYAPKGRPDATYLATFAAFDEAAFVRAVQSVPWEFPFAVSAFVRVPGASRFETVDLQLAFDIGRDRKLAAAHGWAVPIDDDQATFLAEAYPTVLNRRRELILDSINNPHRHFNGYDVVLSVTTGTPWHFECIRVSPEARMTSGTCHEFGSGEDDWTWVTVRHRTICADLAFRGVYCRLLCDEAEVGPTTFEQVRAAAEPMRPGDRVRIAGVIDVRADGECIIERIGRLDRVAGNSDPSGQVTR